MIIRPDVELANMSDVGCVRSANEDSFLYAEPQDDAEFMRRGRLLLLPMGWAATTEDRSRAPSL